MIAVSCAGVLEPFPTSVCHGCRFVRPTGNARGSRFLSCTEPTLPRYLPQPVRACERRVAEAAS